MFGKDLSGLSEPTNDEGDLNAAWKSVESKESQMRDHGDVKMNDAEKLE